MAERGKEPRGSGDGPGFAASASTSSGTSIGTSISRMRSLPLVVLIVSLSVTVAATGWTAYVTHQTLETRFQNAVDSNVALIRKRIDTNVALLSGISGLFAAQREVTKTEFAAYVERLELKRRYPGIFGVGFALAFTPSELPLVEARAAEEGLVGFRLWPAGARELLTTIFYIEPQNPRNLAAIGYDMFSEPTRRAAMIRARDSGEPALSNKVTLVQEITEEKQAGFLLYLPVYTTGTVPDTVEERRRTLHGFVYGIFRADDLFQRLYHGEPRPNVSFQVYDGDVSDESGLLHDSRKFDPDELDMAEPEFSSTTELSLYGQRWTVRVMSRRSLAQTREQALVPLVGLVGALVSLLLFSLVRRQGDARRRAEMLAASTLQLSEERSLLLSKEQAARAEAEEANRLKDEFLATVSHELRTPLTAILGWTHLLTARTPSPERVARGIDVIDRNARAQAQLVEDLLDVSRIITGKLRLDPARVSIARVIDAAIDTMRPAADAKGIVIVRDVDEELAVVGDAARLQQVVWNLMSNAVKFTPEGGRVEVHARRRDDTADIRVTDTGKGIDPRFLPHVFDRFRQAEAGTNRGYGGLGIGLAIVRHLVELHGGTVMAASEGEGRGATFVVSLPLSHVPAGDVVSHAPAVRPAGPGVACPDELKDARVLVVDDEDDAREVMSAALESCGVHVTQARSAAEALDVVQRERPDLIVSDIGMPHEDGFTLIRRIRELPSTAGGATRALAVTAYARADERRRILAAGFDAHLAKPFDVDELLPALAAISRDVRP